MHAAWANRDSGNSFMSPLEQNAKGDGETVKEEGLEAYKKQELANAYKKQKLLNYFCLAMPTCECLAIACQRGNQACNRLWESSIALPHSHRLHTDANFTPVLLTPCNRALIKALVSHAYIESFKRLLRVKASEH